MHIFCPRGYRADPRYSIIHVGENEQIETFTMYCVTCAPGTYSLSKPLTTINKNTQISVTQNVDQECVECPYGAQCHVNVKAKANFWGENVEGRIHMYLCPPGICCSGENCLSYDSCAPLREGLLCSSCFANHSESWFTSKCITDSECEQNMWIWGLVAFAGCFYVFLFLMEEEISLIATNFSTWMRYRLAAVKEFLMRFNPGSGQPTDNQYNIEDKPDFRSAYLEIFMYYVQVPDLYKVNIIYESNRSKPIDEFQKIVNKLYSFNTIGFDIKTCLFKGVPAVYKGVVKCGYIGYLFMVCGCLYGLAKLITFKKTESRLSKVKKIISEKHQPLDVRFALTFCSLLVYTFQYLAENSFILLQCIQIASNDNPVLFIDPYVECYNFQQYIVIAFMIMYVIPFAFALLLSPVLLKEGFVGVKVFLFSFIFPALMLPYFCYCHIKRSWNKPKYAAAETSISNIDTVCSQKQSGHEDVDHPSDMISTVVTVDSDETANTIAAAFIDAYREDLPLSLCWEGVMTLRRFVLTIVATFIGNVLYSHMALMIVTFCCVSLHLAVKPFRKGSCNTAETISLMLHLFFSMMNLLKASYFQSGEVPVESADDLFYIYDFIEFIFLGVFPTIVFAFVCLAVFGHAVVYTFGTVKSIFCKKQNLGSVSRSSTGLNEQEDDVNAL